MRVKIFATVLGNVPAGESPATHLEDQINDFLKTRPNLQIMATHMNTLVVPADPAPSGVEPSRSSVIIFTTMFFQ